MNSSKPCSEARWLPIPSYELIFTSYYKTITYVIILIVKKVALTDKRLVIIVNSLDNAEFDELLALPSNLVKPFGGTSGHSASVSATPSSSLALASTTRHRTAHSFMERGTILRPQLVI